MEPVRVEQLNLINLAQLPDIGIWRSPLTTRMMLTGRIGVNKELVTKDLPFLNIRVDKIEVYKAILDVSELVDKSYEGVNNADLEEIDTFLDQEVFNTASSQKLLAISMQLSQRMGICCIQNWNIAKWN